MNIQLLSSNVASFLCKKSLSAFNLANCCIAHQFIATISMLRRGEEKSVIYLLNFTGKANLAGEAYFICSLKSMLATKLLLADNTFHAI